MNVKQQQYKGGHPAYEEYYDEDDFVDQLDQYYQQQRESPPKKQMTLAEEKEALKRKIKGMDVKKKQPPKYKKEPKDILNDMKAPTLNSEEDAAARA